MTLGLILDLEGRIVETVKVQENDCQFQVGTHFVQHVDDSSIERFLGYLKDTLQHGHSFGGELILNEKHHHIALSVAFLKLDNQIVMISLKERQETLTVLNEIIKINNEQLNSLRQAQAFKHYSNDDATAAYLQEWTALNSELVNTQRELAQKNRTLNKLNQTLHDISIRDDLTGLKNRRAFFHDVLASAQEKPLILVMIDLNGFKSINDRFGHHQGDQILKAAGDYLQNHMCDYEVEVYRLGGDEFALAIPTSLYSKLNIWMEQFDHHLLTLDAALSAAFGAANVHAKCTLEDLEKALIDADENMYQHKLSQGRKRCNHHA